MMKPAAGRAPLALELDKGACNWHAWVKRAQEDATSLPSTELVQYLAELMATNARPALAGWGVKTTAALLAAHAEDAAALPEPQNTDPASPLPGSTHAWHDGGGCARRCVVCVCLLCVLEPS